MGNYYFTPLQYQYYQISYHLQIQWMAVAHPLEGEKFIYIFKLMLSIKTLFYEYTSMLFSSLLHHFNPSFWKKSGGCLDPCYFRLGGISEPPLPSCGRMWNVGGPKLVLSNGEILDPPMQIIYKYAA